MLYETYKHFDNTSVLVFPVLQQTGLHPQATQMSYFHHTLLLFVQQILNYFCTGRATRGEPMPIKNLSETLPEG